MSSAAQTDGGGVVRAYCVQAHPRAGKEERRSLCRLIDARKLSAEAAAHAVSNDRLPVRCVVQVLFRLVSEIPSAPRVLPSHGEPGRRRTQAVPSLHPLPRRHLGAFPSRI
ncbi:hypothetical protein C2845_PM06G05950 [Panicum miliaceum]|uniref:NPH3 domain-containing protein n=1 Tax=Panicum miliaceum TaxID=4540 RepID=A0A3L6RAR9_PANMI|nr:hypothetical protein C2845_PM06G05950 [Panicum miliaceum]